MKKLISSKDEKSYTHIKKLLEAIRDKSLDYNWLITDCEILTYDKKILKKFNCDYTICSTKRLIKILNKDDFQWVWGVLSAIPKKYKRKSILEPELPFCQDNEIIWDNVTIQHPLAEIEIVADDSSSFFVVAKNDNIIERLKEVYTKSIIKE